MEIKTFGKISEIINQEITIHFPLTLAELKSVLEQNFPALVTIAYTIAIDNQVVTDENIQIQEPKIIAIMPPFSGG